ncbi:hypothetical protein [uncultured Nostoc sp.]
MHQYRKLDQRSEESISFLEEKAIALPNRNHQIVGIATPRVGIYKRG